MSRNFTKQCRRDPARRARNLGCTILQHRILLTFWKFLSADNNPRHSTLDAVRYISPSEIKMERERKDIQDSKRPKQRQTERERKLKTQDNDQVERRNELSRIKKYVHNPATMEQRKRVNENERLQHSRDIKETLKIILIALLSSSLSVTVPLSRSSLVAFSISTRDICFPLRRFFFSQRRRLRFQDAPRARDGSAARQRGGKTRKQRRVHTLSPACTIVKQVDIFKNNRTPFTTSPSHSTLSQGSLQLLFTRNYIFKFRFKFRAHPGSGV